MASAKEHALIGAGVAVAGWLIYSWVFKRPLNLLEGLAIAGIGAIGGLIPDLVEPAVHPNHRGFFHSYAASAMLICANHCVRSNEALPRGAQSAVHVASLGFLSHLVADAATPMGLPWV